MSCSVATRFEGAKAHYVVEDARDNVLARTVSGWGERSVITVGAARYDFRRSLRRSRFAVTNAANSEPLLTTRIVAGARSADTPILFRGHSLAYRIERDYLIVEDCGAGAILAKRWGSSHVSRAVVGHADLGDDLPFVAAAVFVLLAVLFPPYV